MQCPTDGTVPHDELSAAGTRPDRLLPPTCRRRCPRLDRGEIERKIIERSLAQAARATLAPRHARRAATAAAVLPAAVPGARLRPARLPAAVTGRRRRSTGSASSSAESRARDVIRWRRRGTGRESPVGRRIGEHMEYVEIARAESERGELVLRERRSRAPPTALELRANGVFVMDTHRDQHRAGARRAPRSSWSTSPRDVLVGGLGLGYTMHGVLADAGSSAARSSRSSRRSSTGCATAPSRTARRCWPTSGPTWSSPTSRWRSPRRPTRRTTWCCWTSTTAPATSSTTATPPSTSRLPGRGAAAAPARWRAGRLVRRRLAGARGRAATRSSATPRPRAYDVRLQERDEQYWLHVARVPSAT